MTLAAPAARTAALGGALLVFSGIALLLTDAPLGRDRAFQVSRPSDGAVIGGEVEVAWTGVAASTSYAVLVDAAIPAPGALVTADPHVLIVRGRSVRLSLGRARTGSPSARGYHTVTVVPLDAAGHRRGAAAAVVHLRNSS